MPTTREVLTEREMRALGAELAEGWNAGDVVLLSGPLGAGKTTLVRGVAESLGVQEPVRSPTFNLIQVFPTQPPLMHADLYRVGSYEGVGLEDYLETHLSMIEWPDRAVGLIEPVDTWRIEVHFTESGRVVTIIPPGEVSQSI